MIEIIYNGTINQDKALEAKKRMESLASRFSCMKTVVYQLKRLMPDNIFANIFLKELKAEMQAVAETYHLASVRVTMKFRIQKKDSSYIICYEGEEIKSLQEFYYYESKFVKINNMELLEGEWLWNGFKEMYIAKVNEILKTLREAFAE